MDKECGIIKSVKNEMNCLYLRGDHSMEIGVCSDVGKVRDINEDAYSIPDDSLNLFMVADGMGGHNAGEVASSRAINSIRDFMKKHVRKDIPQSEEELCQLLKSAIHKANQDIFLESLRDAKFQGMGTTITAILILSKLYIAHIGDSRAYLIHNDRISQVTQDHSLVGELLRNGTITENEAKVHPQRNIITRALGTEENINIDIYEIDFKQDDVIVLCTDGLSNFVDPEEIKDMLLHCNNVQEGCQSLVDLANERGGHDNITVLAVKNKSLKIGIGGRR